MEKVVLAFSGGLDTSFCCIYLTKDLGMEVHSVIVNTGGFSEDELKTIEKRAYELGVKSHTTIDDTQNYQVFDLWKRTEKRYLSPVRFGRAGLSSHSDRKLCKENWRIRGSTRFHWSRE
jgi:argininosuccinate synthase